MIKRLILLGAFLALSSPALAWGPMMMGGTLMYNATVPIKKRVWGSLMSRVAYEFWDWFVLSSASITGNADTGTLSVPQSATADSTVICMPSGSKTVQITATVTAGFPTYYYRTSATTNFYRNAEIAWTAYTGAFETTDQFIQVRATNTAETTATLSDITLDWSGSSSPSSGTLFSGSGGIGSGAK